MYWVSVKGAIKIDPSGKLFIKGINSSSSKSESITNVLPLQLPIDAIIPDVLLISGIKICFVIGLA